MPASLFRPSAYAIVLASGLACSTAVYAGTAAPLADSTALTGQRSSVSVSNMNVTPDKSIFLIVGAESANSNAGAATIYGRVNGVLKKVKTLNEGEQPDTEYGKSVSMALNGKYALVGAPNYGVQADSFDAQGSAFLYTYKNKTWQKVTALTGTDPVGFAHQGQAVFISPDGSTAFVGGPSDNNGKGAVWVYDLSSGTAVQKQKLVPRDAAGEYGSRFGGSISSSKDGKRVVIGGESDSGKGAVWVFNWNKSKKKWVQGGAKIVPGTATEGAGVGAAVSMTWDGNTFAVSAPGENDYKGAVYVYSKPGKNDWTLKQRLTDSNAPEGYAALGVGLAIQPDNGATVVASEPFLVTSTPTPPPVAGEVPPPVEWRGRVLTYVRADANTDYTQASMITANPCNALGYSLAISQSGDALFAGSPQTVTGTTETGGTCFYSRAAGSNDWTFMGVPIVDK